MTTITSKSRIAEQAREAGKFYVDNPSFPALRNPFNEAAEPEHFALWKREFERALLEFSAAKQGEPA